MFLKTVSCSGVLINVQRVLDGPYVRAHTQRFYWHRGCATHNFINDNKIYRSLYRKSHRASYIYRCFHRFLLDIYATQPTLQSMKKPTGILVGIFVTLTDEEKVIRQTHYRASLAHRCEQLLNRITVFRRRKKISSFFGAIHNVMAADWRHFSAESALVILLLLFSSVQSDHQQRRRSSPSL